jgi:hypothetical protein
MINRRSYSFRIKKDHSYSLAVRFAKKKNIAIYISFILGLLPSFLGLILYVHVSLIITYWAIQKQLTGPPVRKAKSLTGIYYGPLCSVFVFTCRVPIMPWAVWLVTKKKVLPKFGHVKNWDYAKIEIIKFSLE